LIDYSDEHIGRSYNKDLAGQIGNLLQRTTTHKLLNRVSSLTVNPSVSMYPEALARSLKLLPGKFNNSVFRLVIHLESQWPSRLICPNSKSQKLSPLYSNSLQRCVYPSVKALGKELNDPSGQANRYVGLAEPWKRDNKDALASLLYSHEVLRFAGILLWPFIPTSATKLLDRLGIPKEERRLCNLDVIGTVSSQGIQHSKLPLFPKSIATEE
jgi:methionyl-tRNA synthetase